MLLATSGESAVLRVANLLPSPGRPAETSPTTFGHSRIWVSLVRSTVELDSAASYLGGVSDDPIIAPSALKHGVSETDILHAYRNPIRVWDLGDGFTMMIGANAAAIIFEIGYVDGETAVVIIHAMRAREKFLR